MTDKDKFPSGSGPETAVDHPNQPIDIADLRLENGVVIDAFRRRAVAGLEVTTVDSRFVVGGLDAYCRFARAAARG